MSSFSGPKAVTDGLKFAVDASNIKSFRGDSTTNLMPTITSWSSYVTTPTTETAYDFPGSLGFAKTVKQSIGSAVVGGGGTYGGFYRSGVSSLVVSGDTVSVSFWVRSLSGNITCRLSNQSGAGDESNLSFTFTATSVWTRVSNSVTLTSTKDQFYIWNGSTASGVLQITDFQLEKKSYVTTYTETSRGTTVATGGGWADVSGNSVNGTLTNGPTEDFTWPNCVVLDGSNDYVDFGNSPTSLSNLTISVWVKNTASSSGGVVSKGLVNDANEWGIVFGYSNPLLVVGREKGNATQLTYSWANYTSGFHHIVYTVQPSVVANLYIDGVRVTTGVPASSIGSTSDSLQIGRHGTTYYLNGRVGEARIYDRFLSADEVLQLYDSSRGRYGR